MLRAYFAQGHAYHLGPERLRDWYHDPETDEGKAAFDKYASLTYDKVWKDITNPLEGKVSFVKDVRCLSLHCTRHLMEYITDGEEHSPTPGPYAA